MLAPLKVFAFSVLLNVILNFLLVGPLRHQGLALATSLSVIFNMAVLIFWLRKKLGSINGYSILFLVLRISLASVLMGGGIYVLSIFFDLFNLEPSFLWTISYVIFSIILGTSIIAVASHVMKIEEFKLLINSFFRKNQPA